MLSPFDLRICFLYHWVHTRLLAMLWSARAQYLHTDTDTDTNTDSDTNIAQRTIPIPILIPILLSHPYKYQYRYRYWNRYWYGTDKDMIWYDITSKGIILIPIFIMIKYWYYNTVTTIQIQIPSMQMPILADNYTGINTTYWCRYWYRCDTNTDTWYRWNTTDTCSIMISWW